MPLVIPTISTEYISVPITASGPLASVEVAFLAPGVTPGPADWHPALYADGVARILVGPDGGTVTLPAEQTRVMWVRADAGTEHPARPAGYVVASDLVTA